jgi:hypothetical protein
MTCTTNLTDLKKEISSVVTNEYATYNVKRRDNYLKVHAGPETYLMTPDRSKSILPTIPKPKKTVKAVMDHVLPFIWAEYICKTLQANGFEIISINKLNFQRPHLEGGFK